MKALGHTHVCRSAQNGLGDLEPCGSKPLCRSLGTISSSRCHRTRDMQTLRGEAWMQARISFLMDEPNCSPPSHKATADNLRGSKAGLPTKRRWPRRLVEPDGIEPTTSCLQSRRSPS